VTNAVGLFLVKMQNLFVRRSQQIKHCNRTILQSATLRDVQPCRDDAENNLWPWRP